VLHGLDPNRIPIFYVDTNNTIRDATNRDDGMATALDIKRPYTPFTIASAPSETGLSSQSMDIYLYYQYNGSALAEVSFRGGYWNFTATIIHAL
jgi:hypothetical protein